MTGVSEGSSDGRVTRCPECAWTRGARPIPQGLRHWTGWFPALLLALALAGVGLWFAIDQRVATISSGTLSAFVVEPPFTPAAVESIAEGRDGPGGERLVEAITAELRHLDRVLANPGARAIELAFASADQPRRRTTRIGWPGWWLIRVETRSYADGVAREGFIPARTDPRRTSTDPRDRVLDDSTRVPRRPVWTLARGEVIYTPPPERTGGVVTRWTLSLSALGVLPAAAIIGWLAGLSAATLIGLVRRKRTSRRTAHRVASITAYLALGVLLVAAFGGARAEDDQVYVGRDLQQRATPTGQIYFERVGFVRLPWTAQQFLQRAGEPSFAAEVASATLDGLSEAPEVGTYLVLAVDCESILSGTRAVFIPDSVSIVQLSQTRYERRPDFGASEPMVPPRGLTFHRYNSFVEARWSTGDPTDPVHEAGIDVAWAALLVVALWGIWWVPRRICVALWRARAGGRLARGICPQCGYEIGSLLP